MKMKESGDAVLLSAVAINKRKGDTYADAQYERPVCIEDGRNR